MAGDSPLIEKCPHCGVKMKQLCVFVCKKCGTYCCDHCGDANGNCHECKFPVDFVIMVK